MLAGKFDHLLHPLVRYERIELAPEKNAFASWQAAGEAIADTDELGNLSYLFDPDCGCGEAACLACQPPPPDELRRRLLDVLQKNVVVRPHFERGLELGRLQLRLNPPRDFEGGLGIDGMPLPGAAEPLRGTSGPTRRRSAVGLRRGTPRM